MNLETMHLMEDTDNFAYTISEIQAREEAIQREREAARESLEAQERSRPRCWAITVACFVIVMAVCYFNP